MRILWHSNPGFVSTGYGQQTRAIVPLLRELGHEVAVSASCGLQGAVLEWEDVPVFPTTRGQWGHAALSSHVSHYEPDIVISLSDAWTFPLADCAQFRWVPWVPVDTEPVAPAVLTPLTVAYQPIAFAPHGMRMLARAGVDARYVPHGIDTALFSPGDQAAARRALGLPVDAFVVGMVAANVEQPSRKAFPQQLSAFARLKRKHPDALLYLHSDPAEQPGGGVHLPSLCQSLGLRAGKDVVFPDLYSLNMVGFSPDYMVSAYRAMDVLLSTSMGEGFCLPLIEAQACGTPVITGAWLATEDLCFGGWLVEREKAEPFWNPLGAWQFLPRAAAIAERLDQAYKQARDGQLRKLAREGAAAFEITRLVESHWRPVLAELAERIEAEPAPCAKHRWYSIGVRANGSVRVPCRTATCPAQRIETAQGWIEMPRGYPIEVAGVHLDIEDDPTGGVAKVLLAELAGTYHLDRIELRPGDVVIDVGAHVGVISCFLAKQNPGVRVLAFEPWPENFARLERNIAANGVGHQVQAFNLAVSADGRPLLLSGAQHNSGAVSAFITANGTGAQSVESVTLADIFARHDIESCRLLKIDCEGAEYEILNASAALLGKVKELRAEVHSNAQLRAAGYEPAKLAELLAAHMPGDNRWRFHVCEIED